MIAAAVIIVTRKINVGEKIIILRQHIISTAASTIVLVFPKTLLDYTFDWR